MNPEQERRHRTHEGLGNLQPPEYEPRDPTIYGRHAAVVSGAARFWFVLAATLAIVGVAAAGIWWLTS